MRPSDLAARVTRLERAAGQGRAGPVRWLHMEGYRLSNDEIAARVAAWRDKTGWRGKVAVTLAPEPAPDANGWLLRWGPAAGQG